MVAKIEKNFPFFVILASIIAMFYPQLFLLIKPHIPIFLGIIMFCIGLTLRTGDFKQVLSLRWQIILLALLKYLLLPIIAFVIAYICHLSHEQLIGLLIVSACPGGTAAGVMSYLSGANVALTIVLTFLTTLLSPIVTPFIIYLFLHKHIPVPWYEMSTTILWVMLFPLLDGLLLRKIFGKKIDIIKPVLPIISMLAICLLIACIVALNRNNILSLPILALAAVILDNVCGLVVGYAIAKMLFKFNMANSYAVSFEFGIQDSGLAVMLATKFFGISAALCGALFSVVQNLTGPGLVKYFRYTQSLDHRVPKLSSVKIIGEYYDSTIK